jgi:hypothetical protein
MMNLITILGIISGVLIVLSLPSSILFVQNASALASVAQITSAKADGSNLVNGGFATIAQGKTTVMVTFDYRGFDDNDHVLELRCSWDGVNYQKSNCSYESAESRTTFTGPDGVSRAYYVKTGTASRDLTAPPVPKTYTFGVKVLNENGNLSPAATWTFKMRSSTTPPVGGAEEEGGTVKPENNIKNIRVSFDSITVHNDHRVDVTGTTPGFRGTPGFPTTTVLPGEWILDVYVQGKAIPLLNKKEVLSGKTYYFKDKSTTVDLKSNLPLSILTFGAYADFPTIGPFTYGYCTDLYDESQGPKIFTHPTTLWEQKIRDFQEQAICIDEEDSEDDSYKKIGFVSNFILPPDYKSWLTPEQIANAQEGTFSKYVLDGAMGPDFVSQSSTKDFILRYTISVEPINK